MRFMADDCAFETTAGSEVCGQRYERREALRKASARVFSIFPGHPFRRPAALLGRRSRSHGVDVHGGRPDGQRVEV